MDREQILQQYNIDDEFSEEWVEPKEFEELNLTENGEELSKYALLRQLAGTSGVSSEAALQDEPDPLGSTDSVISVVESRGIDVDDPTIRGQYLISSSRFNAKAFLRDVHSGATYNNLVNSLDYLEGSIQERSEALRFMVERDYDRFVKSKSLLDSVLDQINQTGFNQEHEWGLGSMKGLIDDSNSKLAVIMKPVIDNQARESRLRAALELIKKNKYLFNLPTVISKHIKNHDHDSLIRDYRRGKDMRYNEDITSDTPDYIMQNKKITDRIWREVETIVDEYKKETWKQLARTGPDENYMSVISKLLELGVEDNPIQEWIECQIQQFSDKARDKFEKLTLRTNLMRMNLNALPPSEHSAFILPIKENCKESDESSSLCDSAEVVEMWLTVKRALDDVSANAEKACLFWKSCNEFLEGTRQRNLPTGYQGKSKIHLSFNAQEAEHIRESGRQMIQLFAEKIVQYFESPAPAQPTFSKRNSTIAPQQKTGDESSSFLFLPPYANALGAVRYLSHILSALSASFRVLSQASISNQASDSLRNVLSKIRERCISAVCHCWIEDSKKFSLLEDWETDPKTQRTETPRYFDAYQMSVLQGVKHLVNFSTNDAGSDNLLITQPSTRLLNFVLSKFLSANTNILESWTDLLKNLGDPNRVSYLEKSLPNANADELTPQERTNDAKVLLLLSNVSQTRDEILPKLYKYFEQSFNTPTRDVSKTLYDFMGEMDSKLFEVYTLRKRTALSDIIRDGVGNPELSWITNYPPQQVSPYIYECLLMLVVVHSKVSEVASSLVHRVIEVLNLHVLKQMVTELRHIEQFSDGGMLQAVADIDFWRGTMAKFMAPDAQNQIQMIYGTLKESVVNAKSWDTKTGPRPYVQQVVQHAAQESRLDFACFHE